MGAYVDVMHEDEDPDMLVLDDFLEPFKQAHVTFLLDSVCYHSIVGELSLPRCEPPGIQRFVGKDKRGQYCSRIC